MRLYSNYRNFYPKFLHKSDLRLSNLHEKLAKLPNCLNHIINFNGIDFIPFTTPVVLSRYDVIHSKYKVLKGKLRPKPTKPFTEWRRTFDYETVTQIYENKTSEIDWCQRQSLRHDLECFDIPFVDNTPKSKPWYCESHWYLFPPNPIEDPLFYELSALETPPLRMVIPASYKKFWSHDLNRINNESDRDTRWNFPFKTRSIYDVIITQMRPDDIYAIKAWSISLNVPYNSLFYQYTTTAREELTFSLKTSRIQHNQYDLKETVLFCRHCKKFLTFQPVNIGTKFSEKELAKAYRKLNSNIGNSHWTVVLPGDWDEAYISDTNWVLLHSSPYDLLLSFGDEHKTQWAVLDGARHRFELRLIMQAIVGNGSFGNAGWWNDWLHRKSDNVIDIPLDTRYIAPCLTICEAGKEEAFRFRVHPMKLKFVSCGTAGENGLAFEQLSSIFDVYIWIGILSTTVSITLLCSYIRCCHHEKIQVLNCKILVITFLHEYVDVFKALLEQGDPIANKYLKFRNFRWAFGFFLLMILIVSSAYKNDNITKLTLPRDPIPFDTFDALTNYSFQIYTRMNTIGGYQRYTLPPYVYDVFYKPFMKFLGIRNEHHRAVMTPSELYLFSKGDYSHSLVFDDSSIILPNRTKNVLNNTQLHPDYLSILYNGTPTSVDILRSCNQTALFLPDVEAHEAYYDLLNLKESRDKTYLSKESMFEIDSIIGFGRAVSPKVIDRLQSLEISGIYGWWTDFVVNYMTRVRGGRVQSNSNGEGADVKSNLKGNISVVFVVLAIGWGVSKLVFLGEVWKRLGRQVMKGFAKVGSCIEGYFLKRDRVLSAN
ncbi:unnamed protein product [Orchesella dallaii]|uniref:Uncharacterized protein n=1 Tax=Orchesella dallaii TaxID=48710 RepID=A0ABP1RVX1_9HEXA